jgi:four helix bundle protein
MTVKLRVPRNFSEELMTPIRDFRDLIVWQRSMDFAVAVYALARRLPKEERFEMAAQLRRAAVSVSSNIAEAAGRSTKKDRRHFYVISGGSLKECESLLLLAQRLGYLTETDGADAFALCDETGRMLTRLRQKLTGR